MTAAMREIDRMLAAGEKRGEKRGLKEGEKKGKREGIEEGMARTVLQVLQARGITVPQALRQRIVACSDVRQLTAWARRAAVAASADDLASP